MPVMDGPTLCREMRAAGYVGIILDVTGKAITKEHQTYLDRGVENVLIKPLDMSMFVFA